jgi:type II secretory pathway pseudopilin PulG
MHTNWHRRREQLVCMKHVGFTLTDLLVSLAVLSILLAIVTNQLVKTRESSKLAHCTTNLKQVNQAVLSFCADNAQTLPTVVPGDNRSLWWWYKEQVKKYTGSPAVASSKDLVFTCPSDRGYSDGIPFRLNPRFDFGSFVYNGVTLPGVPSIAGLGLSEIRQPRRTLLVMEWTAHAPLSWHFSKTGKRNMPFYCDAQSVVGFVDGHVNFSKIYYDGYNAAYTQDPIPGYDYHYSGN